MADNTNKVTEMRVDYAKMEDIINAYREKSDIR
jgi:hypothetical protein